MALLNSGLREEWRRDIATLESGGVHVIFVNLYTVRSTSPSGIQCLNLLFFAGTLVDNESYFARAWEGLECRVQVEMITCNILQAMGPSDIQGAKGYFAALNSSDNI